MLHTLDEQKLMKSGGSGESIIEYSPIIELSEKSDLTAVVVLFAATGTGVSLAGAWQSSVDGVTWENGSSAFTTLSTAPDRAPGSAITNQNAQYYRIKYTIAATATEGRALFSVVVQVRSAV